MGVKVVGSQREEGGACQIHLRVPAVCKAPDIDGAQVRVLVDTGAEVCLIKKGLLPDLVVERAEKPLRLFAANNQPLPGGRHVVRVELQFTAVDIDSQKRMLVTAPTLLYQAEMEEDIILSYQWLGERDLDVCPRSHGLRTKMKHATLWIPGERLGAPQRANARLLREPLHVKVAPVKALATKKARFGRWIYFVAAKVWLQCCRSGVMRW